MHRRTLSLSPPSFSSHRGRLILLFSITLLTTLVYVLTPKSTFTSLKSHIGGHPYVHPPSPAIYTPQPDPPSATPPPERLIVKAQLSGEDLNWLLKLRPAWRNAVITLDPRFAQPYGGKRVDKGRIIDAFLIWIVTNYENLPQTIVFVPPGLVEQEDDEQWRIPNQELIKRIGKLDEEYLGKEGYAPLRCPTKEECEDVVLPFRQPPDEFRSLEIHMKGAWKGLFNATAPQQLARGRGGAFAVSRKQVRKREVGEYLRYWRWLVETKVDDDSAGAVVEALWSVIFGREGTWCPSEEECRCDILGEC